MVNVVAAAVRGVTIAGHIPHVEFEGNPGNVKLVDDIYCSNWIGTRSVIVGYALRRSRSQSDVVW